VFSFYFSIIKAWLGLGPARDHKKTLMLRNLVPTTFFSSFFFLSFFLLLSSAFFLLRKKKERKKKERKTVSSVTTVGAQEDIHVNFATAGPHPMVS